MITTQETNTLFSLNFNLPSALEASAPPETRGTSRDDVRLLVSHYGDDRLTHTQFSQLTDHLEAGDVLVINTSGTLPAAVNGRRANGEPVEVHFSTRLPDNTQVIELRKPTPNGSKPIYSALADEYISLPENMGLRLLSPHGRRVDQTQDRVRLWNACLEGSLSRMGLLQAHGYPIRYGYVPEAWPLDYYQTVYATEPGSAEMPSAGRAFSHELIIRLVARGVQFAPLLLHTGVASLEDHEPPYAEPYRVPAQTAKLVNRARQDGNRIIAVGTTAVRALETVTDENGWSHPGQGWTDLIISKQRPMRVVNGLLTGFHEPQASHLAMLQSLTGHNHLCLTYTAALEQGYLWHEFGDLHLILP